MATLLVCIVVLPVALLCAPVTVNVHWVTGDPTRQEIRLIGLLGLLRYTVSGADLSADEQPLKTNERSATSSKAPNLALAKRVLERRSLRRRLVRIISDCWRSIDKRDVSLAISIGLEDPADTGRLSGILSPLSVLAAQLLSTDIRFQPAFDGTQASARVCGQFRFTPIRVVLLCAAFALSPFVWQDIRAVRREA